MNRLAGLTAMALAGALLLAAGPARAEPAFVTTRLNLQSGPGEEYPPVAFLEPGVQVEVIGCLQGYGWCDVSIGRDRGWVAGSYLQAAWQERRAPLVQVAPSLGLPVIGFSVGSYWERNYRDRPWYAERDRWGDRRPAFAPGPDWHRERRDWDRHDRDRRDDGPRGWDRDRPRWDEGRRGPDGDRGRPPGPGDGPRPAGGPGWDRGPPGGPPDRGPPGGPPR